MLNHFLGETEIETYQSYTLLICCCSAPKSCLTLCDSMNAAYQALLSFTISQSFLKFMCHLVTQRPGRQLEKKSLHKLKQFFFPLEFKLIIVTKSLTQPTTVGTASPSHHHIGWCVIQQETTDINPPRWSHQISEKEC